MAVYVFEDGCVKFEVVLLDLPDCFVHLFFNLFDLLVSLVDGDGLYLIGKGEFFDHFLNICQFNTSAFLHKRLLTKKSNISTIKESLYYNQTLIHTISPI